MQSTTQLTAWLQQINHSFIAASFYDPTTYYLGDTIIDRDEFKKLKKEGLIEVSFQDNFGKRYTLSSKGREYIKRA
jgi:predicted HAD superfamily phosphohydrolase